jgi:hypothetical protein
MIPYLFYGVYDGASGASVARIGASGGAYQDTGHTSISFSVTISAGTDFAVVNVLNTYFATVPAITSVTLDGVGCTLISGANTGSLSINGTNNRIAAYGLVNPNVGTYNCVVTYASTVGFSSIAVQGYENVNTTTPTEGGFQAGVNAAAVGVKTIAPTTTTVSGDYLVSSFITTDAGGGLADLSNDGTDIREDWDSASNGTLYSTADKALTGSGQDFEWTNSQFRDWTGIAYVIKAASGGGSGSTGTLALTTANDTSSASGSTTIVGTLALTTADDTSSASGVVGSATGTVNVTTADDTSSASGTTTVLGNVSVTTNNDTSNASGSTTVIGSVSLTTGDDVATASGNTGSVTGTVNVTTGNDTATAEGNTPASQTQAIGGGLRKKSRLFVIEVDGTEYRVPQSKLQSFLDAIPQKVEEKKVQRKKTSKARFEPVEIEIISAPIEVIQKLDTAPIYASLKANKQFIQAAIRYQQELDDEEAILLLM